MLPYCLEKVKDLVFSEHVPDAVWVDKTNILHLIVKILNNEGINEYCNIITMFKALKGDQSHNVLVIYK